MILANYVLPLGNALQQPDDLLRRRPYDLPDPRLSRAAGSTARPTRSPPASTKTWAMLPAGYDGVDNDQDGLIDDWAEGVDTARTWRRRSRPVCKTTRTSPPGPRCSTPSW